VEEETFVGKKVRSNGFLRCSLAGTLPQVLRQTDAYCRAVKATQAAVVVTGAAGVGL
jgi:hypothetical protein